MGVLLLLTNRGNNKVQNLLLGFLFSGSGSLRALETGRGRQARTLKYM
jgi:hypothetical protein